MGLGKALKSTLHPIRTDIPIYLAAEGPKNVALSAEVADGWFPLFYGPKMDTFYRDALNQGFSRNGAGEKRDNFEVVCNVPIVIMDDPEMAANAVRPMLALYAGGMGARGANFHYDAIARMGYEEECAKIQDLYLQGKKVEAQESIPLKMVEDMALVGPIEKIRDEIPAWKDSVITTMLVAGPPPMLEQIAKLVL